jgi:hypothetical protein
LVSDITVAIAHHPEHATGLAPLIQALTEPQADPGDR